MTSAPSSPTPVGTVETLASQKVMYRALKWGGISTLTLAVVAGILGFVIAGAPGLWGGLLGAVFAGLFVALTAASIAIANLFIDHEFYLGLFFGVVMGGWLLKFIVFLIAAFTLKDQTWLSPKTMFVTIIVGVVLSLGLDVWIMKTSRIPSVSELVLQKAEAEAAARDAAAGDAAAGDAAARDTAAGDAAAPRTESKTSAIAEGKSGAHDPSASS